MPAYRTLAPEPRRCGSGVSAGTTVRLRRVPELIPQAVIDSRAQMKAAQEEQRAVETATVDDLLWADGIALGFPTRFGNLTAQLKNFLDQRGALGPGEPGGPGGGPLHRRQHHARRARDHHPHQVHLRLSPRHGHLSWGRRAPRARSPAAGRPGWRGPS